MAATKKVRKVQRKMEKVWDRHRAQKKSGGNKSGPQKAYKKSVKAGRAVARKQISKGRPGLRGKAKKQAVNRRSRAAQRRARIGTGDTA